MMDRVKGNDGHTRWILGPVEMSIVGAIPVALVGVMIWLGTAFADNLSEQSDAIAELSTQQAVTNAQLTTLTQQLADVPGLTRQMAELKVQVERNSDDIKELRSVRGLR